MGGCFTGSDDRRMALPRTRSKPRTISNQQLYEVPLAQLADHLSAQLFILSFQYDQFHKSTQNQLKQYFPNLRVFENLEKLKIYTEDGFNNILVVICNSPEEAVNLRELPNFYVFSRICIACDFEQSRMQEIPKKCRSLFGFRYGGAIKNTVFGIKEYFQEAQAGRSLYFCHTDQGLINRANLVFDFCREQVPGSYQRFTRWMNKAQGLDLGSPTAQKQSEAKISMMDKLLSMNTTLIQATNVLKKTSNPGAIIHVSWLYSTLSGQIQSYYTQKRPKENYQQFTAWLHLTKSEIALLKTSTRENFMFSTFVIASTRQNPPQPQNQPHLQAYKFIISIPGFNPQDNSPEVDFGFLVKQDKVIFNTQNMYRLNAFNSADRTLEVTYCSIGPQHSKRKTTQRYQKDATGQNMRMMKLFQFYYNNRQSVRSQYDLIFALQKYNLYKKQVLQRTNWKSGDTLESTTTTVQHYPPEKFLQKLGDCQAELANYDKAVQFYNGISSPERCLIKKLYFYFWVVDYRQAFARNIDNMEVFKDKRALAKKIKTKQQKKDKNAQISQQVDLVLLCYNMFNAILLQRKPDIKLAYMMSSDCLSKYSDYYKNFYSKKVGVYPPDSDCHPFRLILNRVRQPITKSNMPSQLVELYKMDSQMKQCFDGIHLFWLFDLQ